MDKNFNTIENKESKEKITSKVELNFFRHSIKEKQDIYDKGDDNLVPLSPEGRKLAQMQGEEDFEQSVAFGSPRIRSQETALYKMAGGTGGMTGSEDLDELLDKVDTNVLLGSKLGVDRRLDFNLSKELDNEYSKKVYDEFSKGNYLGFLINESDQFAEQVGDTESLTYTRGAQQIISIILKYITVADRWDKILEKDIEKKYKSESLKRFMGSHQGVTESFLARVIERRLGKERLAKFVEVLDNTGFDFTEGYRVDIEHSSTRENKVLVSYEKELGDGSVFRVNEKFSVEQLRELLN